MITDVWASRPQHPPQPLVGQHPALPLLQFCPGPWSAELTHAILERLGRDAAGRDSSGTPANDWGMPQTLKAFGLAMAPLPPAETTRGWPDPGAGRTGWGAGVEAMLALLEFRYEMRQALEETTE